ncbi:MAG: Nif11-like leader peptide family natural product precursor [Prochlorococcus sp.]
MSRQGFSDFLHAAEHSASLRREIRSCEDQRTLLLLARRYGFPVKDEDIKQDPEYTRVEKWFKNSQIISAFRVNS